MASVPNPNIMQAVEQLGYRVTIGDVASQAGLNVEIAQQGLLTLAADAGGHMQVAETGDVVYLFPQNFRSILRNKFWRLKLKEWWEKIWGVLFYLIRISFGIILLVSILLIFVAIAAILIAINSSSDSNDSGSNSSSGGFSFFWFPDFYWIFAPSYEPTYQSDYENGEPTRRRLNFLEAVFSFLFGDGNPNANLEKRRWQEIATVIRNNQGAVIAEQIAPYLDDIGRGYSQEYEDYMLPVLARFNGLPQVSPTGDIVYHFPDLQTTVREENAQIVPEYLREIPWKFSEADSGQILLATSLGAVNFIGALVLGSLLANIPAAKLGAFIGFINSSYWVFLAYGIGFLSIPLIRYFWIKWKNTDIEKRNYKRQERAIFLSQAMQSLQKKIAYARQFAARNIISRRDITYTTETDLVQQEIENSARIDAEWQRRLEQKD